MLNVDAAFAWSQILEIRIHIKEKKIDWKKVENLSMMKDKDKTHLQQTQKTKKIEDTKIPQNPPYWNKFWQMEMKIKKCTESIASSLMPFERRKSRSSLLTRCILLPQPSTRISGKIHLKNTFSKSKMPDRISRKVLDSKGCLSSKCYSTDITKFHLLSKARRVPVWDLFFITVEWNVVEKEQH